MPKTKVQDEIIALMNDRKARQWRKGCARPEIKTIHIPFGWLLREWYPELLGLVEMGEVEIVDLPSRAGYSHPAKFVARVK
jgi:hypothetical protein